MGTLWLSQIDTKLTIARLNQDFRRLGDELDIRDEEEEDSKLTTKI